MIFKHSEGCRCEGTKKVKGSFLDHECHKMTAFGTGEDTHVRKGYTDEDGKEEIPNWICELGCPVRALDAQSGILKSGALKKGQYSKGTKGRMFRSGPGGLQEGFDNEEISSTEGGASRYFKQVQSDEELDHYLNTLIRRPSS